MIVIYPLSMPTILITTDPAHTTAFFAPTSFLGSDLFQTFRTALTTGGARAVKVRGGWTNQAPIAAAPKVVAALQTAGFATDMSEDVRAALAKGVQAMVSDLDGADQILAQIKADLARRGQALRQYQIEGVRMLLSERTHVLGDDMGLGKTLQMLCTVPAQGRALVVCPALVKGSFAAEVRKFRPDLVPVILSGRGSFRWPEPGEVVITNYEILPAEDAISDPPMGVVLLIDEIHRCGSSKTQVTAKIGALCGLVLDRSGRTYGATGTLMRTTPPNIWAILGALRLRQRAFRNWDGFCAAFGAWQNDFGGYEWPATCPAGASVGLAKVMLRRTKSEVARDLPPCVTTNMPVTVSASVLRTLDKVAAKTLDKLHRRGIALYAKTLAEVTDKDMDKAMADGVSIGEISAVRETLALAKLPAATEYVQAMEDQGEPLIVFSAHVAVAEAIGTRPGWGLITGSVSAEDRTKIVAEFQAGRLRGVAGTIGAMGVGVTMTRAAQVLFVDESWTPAENAQARDRAHRIGQERSVNVVRMIAIHAVDERVSAVLAEKTERNETSVEAARVNETFVAPALALPDLTPPTVGQISAEDEGETPIDF